MYTRYWNLTERPFTPVVKSSLRVETAVWDEAQTRLSYAIDAHQQLIALTGLPGVGKTQLLKHIAESDGETRIVISTAAALLNDTDLLKLVAKTLQERVTSNRTSPESPEQASRKIEYSMSQLQWQEKPIVLLLDGMTTCSVDRLALGVGQLLGVQELSDARLSIVMCGGTETYDTLRQHSILGPRLGSTVVMRPLDLKSTSTYLARKLFQAGAHQTLFSDAAVEALYGLSGGIPRQIDILADLSLLVGYVRQAELIQPEHVESAMSEQHAGIAA